MKRREFIAATAALAAGNLAAQTQPPARVARVGVLGQGRAESSAANLKAFTESLGLLGWKAGQSLAIEVRYANLQTSELPRLAAELARTNPDVVLCSGPGPAVAFKQLGVKTPVVFLVVADPVALGLAQSLGRPGGNFTGLATINPELFFGKQLELLREVAPRASRLAVLVHPENPTHVHARDFAARTAMKVMGHKAIFVEARARDALEPAFTEAARQRAELVFVAGDSLFRVERTLIAELALKHRLPAMFLFHEHVEAGGLMSYGIDVAAQFRQAAGYVDRILKGAHPRDLPIEEPTKYLLVINMKTAKALGLTIPQSVLLRADRVIE